MNIKFIFLFIWLLTSGFSQTHFTIPQNVWRISFNKYISSGKWIGHDGEKGLKDSKYTLDDIDYSINQNWDHKLNINEYIIEYGFSDKSTFVINIPIVQKFNQKHNLLTCGSIIERKNYDGAVGHVKPPTSNSSFSKTITKLFVSIVDVISLNACL